MQPCMTMNKLVTLILTSAPVDAAVLWTPETPVININLGGGIVQVGAGNRSTWVEKKRRQGESGMGVGVRSGSWGGGESGGGDSWGPEWGGGG